MRTGGRLPSFASMHAVGMCRTVREWAVPGFSRSVWVGFSLSEYNYTATNYNQPLPQALGSTCVKKSFATPFDARRASYVTYHPRYLAR